MLRFALQAPTIRSFFWRLAYVIDFKTARVLKGNRRCSGCRQGLHR